MPIEEVLTTLAGGKRGKTDEKWRESDQKMGVGVCGNTPYLTLTMLLSDNRTGRLIFPHFQILAAASYGFFVARFFSLLV